MKFLKRFIVVLLLGISGFLNSARAEWVGIFLYRDALFDHIEAVVTKDGEFSKGANLNIWETQAKRELSMALSTEEATEFVIFHHNKSREEIVEEWIPFFEAQSEHATILSKNCAWATMYLLNNILHLNVSKHSFAWARSGSAFWRLPSFGLLTPIPDAVRIRLIRRLKKDKIQHWESKDGRGLEFLEGLRAS